MWFFRGRVRDVQDCEGRENNQACDVPALGPDWRNLHLWSWVEPRQLPKQANNKWCKEQDCGAAVDNNSCNRQCVSAIIVTECVHQHSFDQDG